MKTSKRTLAVVSLTMVLVLMASLVASAQSTSKVLSTNFTLVNLSTGSNAVNISYYKQDGTQWRSPEVATLAAQGDQLIRRQYDDATLSAGSGSVVVGGQGALGAVVQILTRSGTNTRAAYSGATSGAKSANAPYVAKGLTTASGIVNSQIIVQNTSGSATNVTIEMVRSSDGSVAATKTTAASSRVPPRPMTWPPTVVCRAASSVRLLRLPTAVAKSRWSPTSLAAPTPSRPTTPSPVPARCGWLRCSPRAWPTR